MGNGLCPMSNCNCEETVEHMLWDCSKVASILVWVKRVIKLLAGDNLYLNVNLFLYGFPGENTWYCVS